MDTRNLSHQETCCQIENIINRVLKYPEKDKSKGKIRRVGWGGVWGSFLEKILPNREKTTPKPTPLFWRNARNHNSFGRFRTIPKTLSPAFHAGNTSDRMYKVKKCSK